MNTRSRGPCREVELLQPEPRGRKRKKEQSNNETESRSRKKEQCNNETAIRSKSGTDQEREVAPRRGPPKHSLEKAEDNKVYMVCLGNNCDQNMRKGDHFIKEVPKEVAYDDSGEVNPNLQVTKATYLKSDGTTVEFYQVDNNHHQNESNLRKSNAWRRMRLHSVKCFPECAKMPLYSDLRKQDDYLEEKAQQMKSERAATKTRNWELWKQNLNILTEAVAKDRKKEEEIAPLLQLVKQMVAKNRPNNE